MANPFEEIWFPHRYKVFHGGRGSGKSFAVAEALIFLADMARIRVLCCREIQNSIRDSSYQLLRDTAERLGIAHHFKFTDSNIRNRNGSQFIFKGLNRNEQSIKSTEGVDVCWVEEAQTVSETSWDTLIPTIRKPDSEIWVTFNCLNADDPTTKRFIENPPPDAYVRKVNYNENPYFPAVLRKEMEWCKANDYEAYLHIWEGFPRTFSDAQIFRGRYAVEAFSDDLAKSAPRLFFGADHGFANDPSTLVRCFIIGRKLYIDYEAYGVGVEINELRTLYSSVPGFDKWTIYADCARPETNSYLTKHEHLRVLGAEKWQGSVEDGIAYLKSFEQIVIHPRCKHTADEFRCYSYKTDSKTNEVLPIPLDKSNHCVIEGTLIETERGSVPVEQVRSGDKVLTRKGFKRVLAAEITGTFRKVLTISTKCNTITCTAEHLIYTINRGFVRADEIVTGDVLLCLKQNQYLLMDTAGTDTQMRRAALTACTLSDQSKAGRFGCIATCGKKQTAKSLWGITFITKTGILLTTLSKIWNAYRGASTRIATRWLVSGSKTNSSILIESVIAQRFGTGVRKGTNGILNTQEQPGLDTPICQSANATSAERTSSRKRITTGFVQTPASPPTDVRKDLTTLKSPANGAGSSLQATNMQRFVFVAEPVLANIVQSKLAPRVYDLTVAEQPEFFANGILVHNCIDALRYALGTYIKGKARPFDMAED